MDINSFVKAFNEEDKDKCVSLALKAVENNEIEITFLYEKVLKKKIYYINLKEMYRRY